ncbi:MAG: Stf0 family sulfotransferase [Devosia sp.]
MNYRALIICATPRSGTTLLCDLLAETGVTGRPNAFYRRESVPDFARRLGVEDGPDFERRYLAAITAEGRGTTNLFSMRVMWPSLPEISEKLSVLFPTEATDAARIASAFGTPLYLFVERKDKVAQAISRVKAEQSGLWHRDADGSVREQGSEYRTPVYDAAAIEAFIAETTAHEAEWRGWFARESIVPMELTYEGLSADPTATVATLLRALGRDPAIASRISPRTAKLADAQSRVWAERFEQER